MKARSLWLPSMVISTAGYTVITQISPLLVLNVTEYGYYSVVYLLFVLGTSLALSLIGEAEARRVRQRGEPSGWGDYSAVSLVLAAGLMLIAIVLCLAISPLEGSVLWGALGVSASTFLAATRFRMIQDGHFKKAVLGDLAGVLSFCAAAAYVTASSGLQWDVEQALAVWSISSLGRIFLTPAPGLPSTKRVRHWVTRHKREVGTLLSDSALQDIGALWTPYALAVVLDVGSMGVYRAVTTMAAPVRLLIAPLRPIVNGMQLSRVKSWSFLLLVLAAGVAAGGTAILFIVALDHLSVDLGVLKELVPFAIPVGLFVLGNALGQVFAISARAHLSTARLILGRAAQAALLGLAPLFCAITSGLESAVWALGVANSVVGFLWYVLLRR